MPLMQSLKDLVNVAGKRILEIYNRDDPFSVTRKLDHSPVTEADIAAQEILHCGLIKLLDIPVLSEEGAHLPFSERRNWTRYWLVDPLDGTQEFLKKNGEFTVNVALIENNQPKIGMIFAPARSLFYFAEKNKGAFKERLNDSAQRIVTRKTQSDELTIVLSRSHLNRVLPIKDLTGARLMQCGSALKFGLVAEGMADLYLRLGPTSHWDTAAGQCIVEESGGCVVDLAGKPLRYNVLASLLNPKFLAMGDRSYPWVEHFSFDSTS